MSNSPNALLRWGRFFPLTSETIWKASEKRGSGASLAEVAGMPGTTCILCEFLLMDCEVRVITNVRFLAYTFESGRCSSGMRNLD
jgi:hypothetical protein